MSDKPPVVNVSGISKELNYDFIDLSLKGERMTLRLADTKQKRYKGLSGVTKLEKNEGMLFSYPTEKRHRLVMRDMEIPLDVVHIGGDGKVNSYGSMSEDGEAVEGVSKWSIELPYGWCEKNDVEEGDPVYIKQPEGKEKINKGRRYVNDPSEVPEQYEVQEGPQGGTYYETEPEPEEEEVSGEAGVPPDPEDFEDIDPEDLEQGELIWVEDNQGEVILAEAQQEGHGWKAYPVREGDERGLSISGLGAMDVVGRATEDDEDAVLGIDYSDNAFYDIEEGEKVIIETDGEQIAGYVEDTGPRGEYARLVNEEGVGIGSYHDHQLVGTWDEVMGDTDIDEDDLTGAEIVLDSGEKAYVLNGEGDSLHMEFLTGPNAGEDIYGISRDEVENLIEPPEVDVDDTHEAIDFSDVDTDEWIQNESYPYQSIKVYDRADGEVKDGFVHYEDYNPQRGKAEGQIEGGGEDGRFTLGDSNRFEVVTAEDFDKLDREGKFDAVINYVRETDRRNIGHKTSSKFEDHILGRNYEEGSLTRAKDWDTINRVARGMDYLKNKVDRASCGGSASKGTWHIKISEDEEDDTIAHELGHAIATSFGFDYIGENQNEEYGPRMLSHNYTQYSDTGSWSGFIDWDLGEESDFYDVEEYMFSWFDDASDGTVDNDYAVGFDDFREAVDQEIEERYGAPGTATQEAWENAEYEEIEADQDLRSVLDDLQAGDVLRLNVPDWDAGRDDDGNPVEFQERYGSINNFLVDDNGNVQGFTISEPNGDDWHWMVDSETGMLESSHGSTVTGYADDVDDESVDDTDSGSGGIPQDPETVTEYLGYKYDGGFNPDAETSEEKMDNLARAVNRAFYKQAKVHDATDDHVDRQKVVMETGYSATNAHETIAQLHEVMQTPTESNKQRANDIFDEHPYLALAYMDIWEPSPEMMEEMQELLQALGIEI